MSSGNFFTWYNGNTTSDTGLYWSAGAVADKWVSWDFGADHTVLITELKYYQQDTTTHGVLQFQGSQNNVDWVSIGTTFTLGGVATQTITNMSGNTTEYRYYRLLGVSGNMSAGPYVYEFEFKICGY